MCAFRFEKGVKFKPPTVTLFMPLHGKWGRETFGEGLFKEVSSFEFLTKRLQELEFRISEEQPLSSQLLWPACFVTFETRISQSICSTSLHHHDPATWQTQPAPEPYELIWENLGMSSGMKSALGTLMLAAFWVMTMFFLIPVGMVQALIEVPRLESYPVIGGFVSNVVVSKLLQSIVPGLALKIFLLLVPPLIRMMLKVAGAVSENELDMGTVSRFFLFQVVVVFFGTVLIGSFFNQVSQWISSPFSVISILGK